jgi:hypothetical protein
MLLRTELQTGLCALRQKGEDLSSDQRQPFVAYQTHPTTPRGKISLRRRDLAAGAEASASGLDDSSIGKMNPKRQAV